MKTILAKCGLLFMGGSLLLAGTAFFVRSIGRSSPSAAITVDSDGLRFHLPEGVEKDFGVLTKPEKLRFDVAVTNISPSPIDLSALAITPPCVHARLVPSQRVLAPGQHATLLLKLESGERPGARTAVMNIARKENLQPHDPARRDAAVLFTVTLSYDLQTKGSANWSLVELRFGKVSAKSHTIQREVRFVVQESPVDETSSGGRVAFASASPELAIETSDPRTVPGFDRNQATEYLLSCTLNPAGLHKRKYTAAISATWQGGLATLPVTWEITDDIELVPKPPITFLRTGDEAASAVVQFTSTKGQFFEVGEVTCDIGTDITFDSGGTASEQHTLHFLLHAHGDSAEFREAGWLTCLIRWSDGREEIKEIPCVIKRFPAPNDSE